MVWLHKEKACAMPFNNKAPWTQTMQTKPNLRLFKMSFSANEKFNRLFERFPRSPFGVLKQITHHFCWERSPAPTSLQLSWCFAEGLSFLQQKRVSSLKRWENNSWTMLTLFENGVMEFLHDEHISNHRTEEKQSPHLADGWACGGGRDHVRIQPMLPTEPLVPFLLCCFCDHAV